MRLGDSGILADPQVRHRWTQIEFTHDEGIVGINGQNIVLEKSELARAGIDVKKLFRQHLVEYPELLAHRAM